MNRKAWLVVCIFSLLLNGSFCFAQQERERSAVEGSDEYRSARELSETKVKNITAIEIKGNRSIATATVLAHIRTKVGDKYSSKALSEDLRNLYNLGYFSDVKMDLQDYQDGVKVIFAVRERSVLNNLYLEGQQVLAEKKILPLITLKKGEFIDERQLKEDITKIEELYAKYGYSMAAVEYEIVTDYDTNKSDLYLLIDEGKHISIRRIIIKGNRAFRDGQIIKVMKTRTKWFFNPGTFKEAVLDEDMERIESFYRRAGYLDASAESEVSIDYNKKSIYVTVFVTEGKRYYVDDIKIVGNENVNTDAIKDKLTLQKDSTFSQEGVETDVAEIQGLYFEKGYIFAQVKPLTALDTEAGGVDITYTIQENQVAYVDKIDVRGNLKTKDIVIRRELRILPGEKFDGAKLKRSRERLINLGFFEEVNYGSEPGSSPDKRDLVVDVKEAKTGEISFGAGYSTVDEFVGFVEIAQKNFDWRNWKTFTGAGQDLRVRASWGTIRKDYLFSFTEPWMFNRPISFGFDGFYNTHDKDTSVGYAYDEKRMGGDLRFGKEFSEYLNGSFIYKIENVDISDVDAAATNDLKKEEGSNVISSGTFGLSHDTRDNVFSPTSGMVLSGTAGCAGGPFTGDKDFYRFTGNAYFYFNPISPLKRKLVIEIALRGGLMKPFGDDNDVPIYERFFAGGANTIRGYEERSVGPIDTVTKDPLGGESMLIGNLEATYPIFDFLKGAAFYDIGNVWAKADDFGSGNFKSSFGLGVRVKTPIGPLKLDYGWPLQLQPGETKKEGRFHFSMSHGF